MIYRVVSSSLLVNSVCSVNSWIFLSNDSNFASYPCSFLESTKFCFALFSVFFTVLAACILNRLIWSFTCFSLRRISLSSWLKFKLLSSFPLSGDLNGVLTSTSARFSFILGRFEKNCYELSEFTGEFSFSNFSSNFCFLSVVSFSLYFLKLAFLVPFRFFISLGLS